MDNITLSAEGTMDPDGDELTYEWFDNDESIGTGAEITVQLPKGLRRIKLEANDGLETGWAQVEIILRELDFSVIIDTDSPEPREGDEMVFNVQLENTGDAKAQDIEVKFIVDGQVKSTETIETTEPGEIHTFDFKWNAAEGDHDIKVVVLDQEEVKTVEVGPPPVIRTNVGGTDISLYLIILLIVIICLVVVGAIMMSKRRKRARLEAEIEAAPAEIAATTTPPAAAIPFAPQTPSVAQPYTSPPPPPAAPAPDYSYYDSTYAPTPEPAPVTAQPVTRAVATPVQRPLPPPPPMSTPSESSEVQKAIEEAEKLVFQAEGRGLNTRRARNFIRIAKTFQLKGEDQKALLYCAKAEALLEE
jgi:hypothetical protein